MTDTQRQAFEQQVEQAWEARYTAWFQTLDVTGVDLHALPRYPQLGDLVSPQATSLPAAVATADVIVVADVSSITATPFAGTDTTFSVERTLKGAPMTTVVVNQAGGPRPTLDWTGMTIADGVGEPLLLPGDRAVLMLQKLDATRYEIQNITGWNAVVSGLVHASNLSPFANTINGQTLATFIAEIQAATV
jgi:hypothetical protein